MPTKAAWIEFETRPDLEFEFYLAEKLGKHVHEIREMPAVDFVRWSVYYGRSAQRQELASKKAR